MVYIRYFNNIFIKNIAGFGSDRILFGLHRNYCKDLANSKYNSFIKVSSYVSIFHKLMEYFKFKCVIF